MDQATMIDVRLVPFYSALANRDLVALQRLVSPDIVVHLEGTSAFAGTYEGLGPVLGLAGRLENRIVQNASTFEGSRDEGDRVTATVRVILRSSWAEIEPRLFESFSFAPDGRICALRISAEDQESFDRFLDRLGHPD